MDARARHVANLVILVSLLQAACAGEGSTVTAPTKASRRTSSLAVRSALNDNSCGTAPSAVGSYFQLQPLPSSADGTLISLNSLSFVEVQFTNATCSTVRVYWINYSGQRILYNTLAPHTAYLQGTYLTHPWVITDANDRALMLFLPDPSASSRMEAYITSSAVSYPLPPPKTPAHGPMSLAGPDILERCSGAAEPVGYLMIDIKATVRCHVYDPAYAYVNLSNTIVWQRYVDKPVGTSMTVCSGNPIPAGWTLTSTTPFNQWQCSYPFDQGLSTAIEITRQF